MNTLTQVSIRTMKMMEDMYSGAATTAAEKTQTQTELQAQLAKRQKTQKN